jgi:hypothetical protein
MGCKVGKLRTKFLSSDSWTWISGHSNPISRITALVREAFDYSLMRGKFHYRSAQPSNLAETARLLRNKSNSNLLLF